MKKFITLILALVVCFLLTAAAAPSSAKPQMEPAACVQKMTEAHRMADCARFLGLQETDPIIVRAGQIWTQSYNEYISDSEIIATVISNEAGYGCTERHMELVGAVIVNRTNDAAFPGTVTGVVKAKGQYNPDYATPGSYAWDKARDDQDTFATCLSYAKEALRGDVTCESDVVYQDNQTHGSGIYETHKTAYSTTYFCHK